MRINRITEKDFSQMVSRVRGAAQPRASASLAGVRSTFDSVASGHRGKLLSPYKSKWEAAYASKLELEKRAGIIKAWWYEPFSLWLPGKVRYKPDFLVQQQTKLYAGPDEYAYSLEIIEVKGWSKNRRDGMTRLKIAASLFPCFVWRLVYRTDGGGWSGEYV